MENEANTENKAVVEDEPDPRFTTVDRAWVAEEHGEHVLDIFDCLAQSAEEKSAHFTDLVLKALRIAYSPEYLILRDVANRPCDSSGIHYGPDDGPISRDC